MIQEHAYQPFLILKGEFHNRKVGDWRLKGAIFSGLERNLDNYAGILVQYQSRRDGHDGVPICKAHFLT